MIATLIGRFLPADRGRSRAPRALRGADPAQLEWDRGRGVAGRGRCSRSSPELTGDQAGARASRSMAIATSCAATCASLISVSFWLPFGAREDRQYAEGVAASREARGRPAGAQSAQGGEFTCSAHAGSAATSAATIRSRCRIASPSGPLSNSRRWASMSGRVDTASRRTGLSSSIGRMDDKAFARLRFHRMDRFFEHARQWRAADDHFEDAGLPSPSSASRRDVARHADRPMTSPRSLRSGTLSSRSTASRRPARACIPRCRS